MSIDYEALVTNPELLANLGSSLATESLESQPVTQPVSFEYITLKDKYTQLKLLRNSVVSNGTVSKSIAMETHELTGNLFNNRLVLEEFTNTETVHNAQAVISNIENSLSQVEIQASIEIEKIKEALTANLSKLTQDLNPLILEVLESTTKLASHVALSFDNVYYGIENRLYNLFEEPITSLIEIEGFDILITSTSSLSGMVINYFTGDISRTVQSLTIKDFTLFFKEKSLDRLNQYKNQLETNSSKLVTLIQESESLTPGEFLDTRMEEAVSILGDNDDLYTTLEEVVTYQETLLPVFDKLVEFKLK